VLAKLRADSQLLADVIENRWAIIPPNSVSAEWTICSGYDEDRGLLAELAAHADLRKALRLAAMVLTNEALRLAATGGTHEQQGSNS